MYFKKIGLPVPFAKTFEPTVGSLYLVVNKHAINSYFQNAQMFQFKTTVDITLPGLQERLIENNSGGICYEQCELLGHALTSLGFEVHRVGTFVGEYKNKTQAPSDHNILFVQINKRWFLIDIGFGYNSIRFPLELNLKETQETEAFPWEKYKFVVAEDHFHMYLWMRDSWFPMYWFPRNKEGHFDSLDPAGAAECYQKMINHPEYVLIRDGMVKFSKMTESGRLGLRFLKPKDSTEKVRFVGNFQSQENPEYSDVKYETEEEFREAIKKHFGLEVSRDLFKV